jgi:formylglycine-generating enzyme required for sulfatase activity
MTTNRPLRVFLCHSSNDKPAVRELYQKLRAEPWISPWLDEEELYPGQDWETEIEKAVESSDVVLVCLSNGSINKRGFVQKELRFALDVALEMPEETIFIIPLRLEECTPPRSLRDWHYADYFAGQRERSLQRLLVSLKQRADSLGLKFETPAPVGRVSNRTKSPAPISKIMQYAPGGVGGDINSKRNSSNKLTLSNGMEFMRIPAGEFIMGSNNGADNEKPQHTVNIPYDYWIARYPITNDLYGAYVKSTGGKHPVLAWEIKNNHPVTHISWNLATAYCKWLNNLIKAELPSGLALRLPTEAEWEKAARGTDGLKYPWGNQFDINKCNTNEGRKDDTAPVDLYSPQGDSPYGCADMSGNVWEWTSSLDMSYPFDVKNSVEDYPTGNDRLVLRGSAWDFDHFHARSSVRSTNYPSHTWYTYGFRVVCAPPTNKGL